MQVKRKLPTLVADSPLVWTPHAGVGWSPVPPVDYDDDYWAMYEKYDKGPLSQELNEFRRDFVDYYLMAQGDFSRVIDVGIGAGAFVSLTGCRGLDINPRAIVWLKERDKWGAGPGGYSTMTFWDSFEHIPDHDGYLKSAQWVFMSLPIFTGMGHALQSKHYRPGEHVWYFTESGLVSYMAAFGFELRGVSAKATSIGREDIMTFAFERPEG